MKKAKMIHNCGICTSSPTIFFFSQALKYSSALNEQLRSYQKLNNAILMF